MLLLVLNSSCFVFKETLQIMHVTHMDFIARKVCIYVYVICSFCSHVFFFFLLQVYHHSSSLFLMGNNLSAQWQLDVLVVHL